MVYLVNEMMRQAKIFLLICLWLFVAWLGYLVLSGINHNQMSIPEKTRSEQPIQSSGIDFTDYQGGTPTLRIKAEKFTVRPRKYGMFRVKSANEVFAKDLHLEMYTDQYSFNDSAGNSQLLAKAPSFGQILRNNIGIMLESRKFGRVHRALIDGFKMRTFTVNDNKLDRVLAARKAVFNFKSKQLELEHAAVEMIPLKRRLSASQLTWDDRKKVWRVGKNATLSAGSRRSLLKGTELTEHLEVIDRH